MLTILFLNINSVQAHSADVVTTVNCSTFGYFTITNDAVTGNTNCAGNVVIPNSVTAILQGAFLSNKNITSVTFGTNLRSIGTSAFSGANLGNLVIPGNVKVIGILAFYQATITSLKIEEGVETINGLAFQFNKNISLLTLPNSVTYIGDGAFAQWNVLTNLTLGNGLKSIGEFSFFNNLITSLSIPKNLESIGLGSFWDQPNLTQFQVDLESKFFSSDNQGVLYDKKKEVLIQAPYAKESIVIPSTVKLIEEFAFINPYGRAAKSLPSLMIPSTVAVPGGKLLEAISKAAEDKAAEDKAAADKAAADKAAADKAAADKAAADKAAADKAAADKAAAADQAAALKTLINQVVSSKKELAQRIRDLIKKYPSERKFDALGQYLSNTEAVNESNYRSVESVIYRLVEGVDLIEERLLNTRTTITCIKGKLIKKVTAVKPKCPVGYKVKK